MKSPPLTITMLNRIIPSRAAKEYPMAGYGKSKKGGFVGNLAKLGGSKRKLALAGDMHAENMTHGTYKKATKQAHKKV
jgi:hypothetical protein